MVVEPPEEDLVGRQAEEVFNSLVVLAQPIQLGVDLNVDLGEQTSSDDLPDETENKMLAALRNVCSADVHDRAADTLRRGDDDVVVLRNLESIERFAGGGLVEDTGIDGVGDGVVDEFTKDQAVLDLVEDLHCICRDGVSSCEVRVVLEYL